MHLGGIMLESPGELARGYCGIIPVSWLKYINKLESSIPVSQTRGGRKNSVGPERESTPLQARRSIGIAENNYWTLPKLGNIMGKNTCLAV